MPESQITKAADNIFADLNFSPQESDNLRVRADLMIALRQLIRSQHWTTEQAAETLRETPAQIDALLQGDIDQFHIDQLIDMLTHAGMTVRIEVLPAE
jgi:predicted XRE-type DNA-binding protein